MLLWSGFPHERPDSGIEEIPQSVSYETEPENRQRNGTPRRHDHPRGGLNVRLAVVEEPAPAWIRWRDPQSNEAQRGFRPNGVNEDEGRLDHQWSYSARKHVPANQVPVPGADCPRRLHELDFTHLKHAAANKACHLRDVDEADGQDEIDETLAHEGHDPDGQQHARKGQDHIYYSLNHEVDPSTKVTRH